MKGLKMKFTNIKSLSVLSTTLLHLLLLLAICATSSGLSSSDGVGVRVSRDLMSTYYSPTSSNYIDWEPKDNRKPAFRNCSAYAPTVKEEQPPNTFVIQVMAEDPDDNTIKYSFVASPSERPKFGIDAKTGLIVTKHTFDRDEPIFEKEIYVTVQATDNGRPPLDDVCTFKVKIEDINDNPPVFNKAKYEESMSQDTQVNQIVTYISATDLDDGNNSIIKFEILKEHDHQYFRIAEENGIIYLNRSIDKQPGQQYKINVRAYNIIPDYPQDAQIEVKIRVIESNKKAPTFTMFEPPEDTIYLKENFSDYSSPIVTLQAVSNVPDKDDLIFELVPGRTEQTNSKKTFVFNQNGTNSVSIYLGKPLDYEAITDFMLSMSVRNTHGLVTEHVVKIKVEDVNDNIPYFTEVKTGTISENEPAGTPVMQVRAFDMDGTEANNIVSFALADNTEFFSIDRNTGEITALTKFDREERDFYNVKVIASDNSPSSLFTTGEPNTGQQVFRIEIADKNDHAPHFQITEYIAEKIPENANVNFLVIEVTALDEDNAAQIVYTIESGNIGDAFKIEGLTGTITVNKPLDYETITDYTLKIKAFDGIYSDYARVTIKVEDVNDNPPVFKEEYQTTIQEELVLDNCILVIEAYDPDIKDRNAEQFIKFFVVKAEQQSLLKIDDFGCLKLIQPLDRDLPNGHKHWQVLIAAIDENGNGLKSITDVTITLLDINDNAPFLTIKMPVIWNENSNPGPIVQLQATDYDEQQNGPPFVYTIDMEAGYDIREKFSIDNDYLYANVAFDREEQKEYHIPIRISDSGSPRMSRVSFLHLIIGDVNDNAMQEGSSKIFVYNYKGEAPSIEIGRVYVNDPDDWDLFDKEFGWKDRLAHEYFRLNPDNGMITMLEGTPAGEYYLTFQVTEDSLLIPRHSVDADVTVTVKEIPEEAVNRSGSIRLYNLTAEDFIRVPRYADLGSAMSMKDRLQKILSGLFNTSYENVDVFTVLNYNDSNLDVRFSAHGSPYYAPERMNGIVSLNQNTIERDLDVQVLMINIDECLIEKSKCETSCTNVLQKSNVPLLVYSNVTSFVGVNAYVQAECVCEVRETLVCLNGGTPADETCECIEGYSGPHCELIGVGFRGNGYAMYPPISTCDNTKIIMALEPQEESGLVMYIGPMSFNPLLPISDFLSLELVKSYPVLTVDYGTGAIRIEHKHIKLSNGKSYVIEILLQRSSIEMTVDHCKLSTCMSLGAPQGPNEFLNVNAPLQLGGSPIDLELLAQNFNWTHKPSNMGYHGCIKNLTINGVTYNIGQPSFYENIDPGCQTATAVAISFGINTNFLIAILVCIAVLLILLLAVVVQKRQQNGWHEKDMDDIRETIINYEDEGGGERDTDYDLNVLRSPSIYEDKPYKDNLLMKEPTEVPDIGGFLGDKKESCDKDLGAYPIDDVRHYAYEGDGNSTGSLSSLASCTDEGDLNFDYLSNFGPRFRKLADMYGEEPSDIDSNVDDDQGWRI